MKRWHSQLWVFCLALAVLSAPAAFAVVTAPPADPNDTQPESQQARLSNELEEMIRQLRLVRSEYYVQKVEDDAKIERARRNREILKAELDDLRKQQEELDQRLREYKSEVQDLKEQLLSSSVMEKSIQEQIRPFLLAEKAAIESGIPYKRRDRIARLQAACNDGNEPSRSSMADKLGGVWSYGQEELRLARSSETYTGRAPAGQGALPHARYFRVGQLILGYVTEDGRQTAMWSGLPDEKRWLPIFDPQGSVRIRDAVEILDRRQAPEFVMLPVAIHSADTVEGAR